MTDARTLTQALGGSWYGRYGTAFCPAHDDDKTGGLSIGIGDSGRLLLNCFAGCGFRAIVSALRARGLLGSADLDLQVEPPERWQARHRASNARSHRRELVEGIWSEAGPISGTLAERHLRGRAITCDLPDSLRFHPRCFHGPTRRKLPAVIGAVMLGDQLVGVHRIWVAEPGRKADVTPAKAMLGPCRGSAVPLSNGPGPLVVAEGIETALSVLDLLAGRAPRVWAALSTAGVAGLVLPETPGELIVAPDGDAPGVSAARELARRARGLGWDARIMKPPSEGKDWNDAVREARK